MSLVQILEKCFAYCRWPAISVLVPGDREVDLKRLEANLPGVQELRLFEDADFAKRPELVKGYVVRRMRKSLV